jgi:hypothetical protein
VRILLKVFRACKWRECACIGSESAYKGCESTSGVQAVRVAIQTIRMLGHEIVYIGCDSI